MLASSKKDGNDNIHLPSAIRALSAGVAEVMKDAFKTAESNQQRVWKRSNEADTEEVSVSTFFGSVGYSGNELLIRHCCSQARMDGILNKAKSTLLGVAGVGIDG